MKLTDFKALTFDCYGTLIDWESGIVDALKSLAPGEMPGYTFRFNSMADFAAAHREELKT